MDHGYEAVLRGDTLEWVGERPTNWPQDEAVEVHITLTAVRPRLSEEERKRRLGEALDALVKSNPFRDIDDPAEWQREMRVDRPLPGREE